MASLKPYNYARLILQGLGFVPGLIGLFLVYMSIVSFQRDWESFFDAMLCAVMFSGMGIPLIFLSYRMIKKFSVVTIKCLSLVVALWFHGWFFDLIEAYIEKLPNKYMSGHSEILVLASVPLALLLYFICRDVLVILTKANEELKT